MSWRFLLSLLFALAYLVWISRGRKEFSRVGAILFLAGSAGMLIYLGCAYVDTLPSHAPLRTVTGFATNRSLSFFDRHNSEFILIEDRTGRRTLFATAIDGPWADKPVRVTYLDDGWFMPRVVRIEVLSDDQFPWSVETVRTTWAGTAEERRRASPIVKFLGLALILMGVFAPSTRISNPGESDGDEGIAEPESSGG